MEGSEGGHRVTLQKEKTNGSEAILFGTIIALALSEGK
jgi:hypothetical protein